MEPRIYNDTANSLLVYQYIVFIRAKLTGKIGIILDNATCHKSKQLQDYCNRNEIKLIYLPAYSPELNPIEKLWGSIKKILKRMSQNGKPVLENLKVVLELYSFERSC